MIYILSSSPSLWMDGPINEANGFLDCLRRYVPQRTRCVFVSALPWNYEASDHAGWKMAEAFEQVGFSFESYDILDGRNPWDAERLIKQAEWIIMGGGHTPSQNIFIHDINLKEKLNNFDGVLLGISAGSMNAAEEVYCLPEEQGEASNGNFLRFREGLGLTKVTMLPHYGLYKNMVVDGLRLFEDVCLPDSKNKKFLFFPDGTYLVGDGKKEKIYGEYFILQNGSFRIKK